MASTIFKGQLSLGLLNIPIKVSAAARGVTVSFNQLHKDCPHGPNSRLKQTNECAECQAPLNKGGDNIIKGYEISKGHYLHFTAEELAAAAPESSKVITITSVVDAGDIDPLLFESSYYLAPDLGGLKGYKVLLLALQAEKKYAIASVTMSQREHVVVIRPLDGGLAFHTMYYADEVRAQDSYGLDTVTVKPQEVEMAARLLGMSAEPFDHASYHDGYRRALEQLIEAKAEGRAPEVKTSSKAVAPVVDIMDALAASIEQAKGKPKSGKAEPKTAKGKKGKVA